MDRETTSERESHWQKFEDGTFTLYVDSQERAVVDPARQGITINYEDGFTAELMVPYYVCAFAEAEKRLGLQRIDDIRNPDGAPDPETRQYFELEADLAKETRTPDQWARAYAARSYHLLTLNGVDRELTDAENRAGVLLADAVAIIDSQDPDIFPCVRDHLKVASGLLAQGSEDQRYGSPSLACDRALAVIEYEDAQLAMRHAAAEEALRRDGSLDWLFEPARSGQDNEMVPDRDASDAGHER